MHFLAERYFFSDISLKIAFFFQKIWWFANLSFITIRFFQASPLPACTSTTPSHSPTTSIRRPSTSLLHPDHARFLRLHPLTSPEQTSIEDITEYHNHLSPSSSTTSSLNSVAAAANTAAVQMGGARHSDPLDFGEIAHNLKLFHIADKINRNFITKVASESVISIFC